MGKSQLVLEDGLSISQDLDLVGKSVESVRQGVREMKLVHAQGERVGCEEERKEEKRGSAAKAAEGLQWPSADGWRSDMTGLGLGPGGFNSGWVYKPFSG
jgi:hypothetical protein